MLLGGRAAEDLVFARHSTGADDDLARATEIARSMVTRYGMNEQLGPMTYDDTQLLFRDHARTKILGGATTLADAVRVTLGPKSHCVLIEKKWGNPIVCDDGVTIARK